jgi:hypothetical protein
MFGNERLKFWIAAGLAGAAVWSFLDCFLAWRKNRLIEDTPASRVRSAAQGYVEFAGRGLMLPGTENKAPLSGIPCTWWHYRIEEREARSWNTIQSGTSDTPFVLDDGTGRCLIDPRGAQVFPGVNEVWYGDTDWPDMHIPNGTGIVGWLCAALSGGRYRYSEQRLQPREQLYAIGCLAAQGGMGAQNEDEAVAERLRGWKHDQKSLLERFDSNHDGVLDAEEWDRARADARRQVIEDRTREVPAPAFNVLSKPTDGRAFLLSASDEESLARKLRRRAVAGIAAFLASSSALTWLLTRV